MPFAPPSVGQFAWRRRGWVRASGGLWTADAPRMLFELMELVEDTGIGALIEAFLGERPALSANKCTLRRVPIDTNTNWHQDGAFLGREVRSLNLWLALSPCGVDAPGLDIVPQRFDRILPEHVRPAIEALLGKPIEPGRCLLFFDEIQALPELFARLRYFHEELPDASLLEAAAGIQSSFERATLLREIAQLQPIEGGVRAPFFRADAWLHIATMLGHWQLRGCVFLGSFWLCLW